MVPSRLPESRRAHGGALLRTAALVLAALTFAAGLRAAEARAEQPRITASAVVQMQALQSIKTSKSLTQEKIDSRLYLALLHQRGDARLASLKAFRFEQPESDNRFPVDILLHSAGGVKPVLNKLKSLGGVVRARSYVYLRISARVHLEDLEVLAGMPEINKVRQAIPFFTEKINTSEGDKTHGAQLARAFYGSDGTGVKVGVISDGVDSLSSVEATGDLPPDVQVLPGQAGSGDEGTAMLEIVHDLAPGAALVFATANPDTATFAQNILNLAAAGCTVIVDDIVYLDESPFEDGPVAQAVNTVTAAGVTYFSSAGNEGNKDSGTSGTWEGDFKANGTLPAAEAGVAHDFGDGGQSLKVQSANADSVILIWAEHSDLTHGFASTDFDLYDMDNTLTNVIDASTDRQDGVGGDDFPFEFISKTFDGERLVVMKFADGTTSSVPMFNLIVFRGQVDPALATNGATRGHSASVAAFSVAATPAASPFDPSKPNGPYPGLFTAADQVEVFSSDGPRRIILDGATGNELTPGNRTKTGGVVRQKPDITAADGVSCAAPGFNPFYGTSAAAPHAAAITALVKAAVPGLTPTQIRTALIASAIDIGAVGVDRDTGAGIVMAQAALAAAGATPKALLTAGAAIPAEVSGDGDAFVENNEVWSLTIPLTNIGAVAATVVNGVLSSPTPGVTIQSASSAYPNLGVSATGNNATPFRFLVGPAVPCGSSIQFVLTVTYTGGISPQTFNFSIGTGSPGAPVTFSYAGPAVPIPDGTDQFGSSPGAVAVAVIPVSGLAGNIFKVVLRIDGSACDTTVGSTTVGIDHPFVSDLKMTLRSPSGTPVLVINNAGGSGTNFCQTVLDDASGGGNIQSVGAANAPFTGSFTPNSPLSAFNAETANGNWTLEVQDFFIFDTGNIRAFSLIITPAVCDATTVSGTMSVDGSLVVGGTVRYTVRLHNLGSVATTDNPGNEFTDVLPATLALVSASSTSGSAVANLGTNTVTWNGGIPASGSVTITIVATVLPAAAGLTVSNQGTISYSAGFNGTNDTAVVTNDPSTPIGGDPTSFVAAATLMVPTLSTWGLLALAFGLVLVAVRRL